MSANFVFILLIYIYLSIYLPKYDDDDKSVWKDSDKSNDRIDDHENQLDWALNQIEQLFQIK